MRTLARSAVLLCAAVAACAEQPAAPPEIEALGPPPVSAAIKLEDFNEIVPVDITILNPCTGESVHFVGTDHQIFKFWDNGAAKIHLQFNLDGTGLTSALKYKWTDAINISIGPNGLPSVFSFAEKVSSATDADNFLAKAQITIDENGVVTVDRESVECVG